MHNMSELLGKYYDETTTHLYQTVLNKVLKEKYEWFDHIIVHRLSLSKSQDYMGIEAELFADEDWVGNQWREFYYSKPMPSGTEDDPIILDELIGGEFSKQLQDDFKTVFMFITSEKRPKYMSHSWIDVKPIEMNKKKLTEQILRIQGMMGINESIKSYIDSEMDEIERAVQDLSRDEDINISVKEVKKMFQNTEPEKLSKSIWKKLENTESNEIKKGDIDSVEKIAKKYNKTSPTKLKKVIESGDYNPPMIIKFKNRYHLVAGNTRLCTAAAIGITPNVLIVEI